VAPISDVEDLLMGPLQLFNTEHVAPVSTRNLTVSFPSLTETRG